MKPLYHAGVRPGGPGDVVAIDTETTCFKETEYAAGGKTRITPHIVGARLVVGSVRTSKELSVYFRDDLIHYVREALEAGKHLVFHNAAFDVHVLVDAAPELRGPLYQAGLEGRLHCTRVLEILTRIARGLGDHELTKGTSLKALAYKYAGMKLEKEEGKEKNEAVRATFGAYEHNRDGIPEAHLHYAAVDAEATWRVYIAVSAKAQQLSTTLTRYPSLPDAIEKFGPLGERNHVLGDIALHWLQRFPVRVDLEAVGRAKEVVAEEARRLEDALCDYLERMEVKMKRKAGDVFVEKDVPWAKRTKAGQFKLSHKAIQQVCERWAQKHRIEAPLTDTGKVSLKRDDWSEHIPRATPEQLAAPHQVTDDTGRLSIWMYYTRLRLMETRYLDPLGAAERHYPSYYSLGARTTRTAARRFPIQQTPKRRDGIRGLFIPEDGHVFIEADYQAAELTGLAQVYHLMFGGSVLGDSINEGKDPHIETARRLWPDFDELPAERQKELRQACKAVNFGLPGGMGAHKFSLFARGYGLSLSIEEARHLRNRALQADPQLRQYLSDQGTAEGRVRQAAKNLGMTTEDLVECLRAWKDKDEGEVHWYAAFKRLLLWSKKPAEAGYDIPTRPGFRASWDLWRGPTRGLCGAVRGRALYTEAHNFAFQNAVAEVGKLALFHLWGAWQPMVCQPVNFIHDSILLQCLDDPELIETTRFVLEQCMLRALREVCPDVKGGVDVEEPKHRWGPLSGLFAPAEEPAPCA